MDTAPVSSTETDIHNNSNDLSTKESSGQKGEKEVNSGVVNGPTQTKKKNFGENGKNGRLGNEFRLF